MTKRSVRKEAHKMCFMLVSIFFLSNANAQSTEELEKRERSCNTANAGGYAEDCVVLGNYYYNPLGGTDTVKDFEKSAYYFSKGCDLDNADGCALMAYLHINGEGVSVDEEKAADLYKKACDLDPGWVEICNEVAKRSGGEGRINVAILQEAVHLHMSAYGVMNAVEGTGFGNLVGTTCDASSCTYMGIVEYSWIVEELRECVQPTKEMARCDFTLGVDFNIDSSLTSNPLSSLITSSGDLAGREAVANLTFDKGKWIVVGKINLN